MDWNDTNLINTLKEGGVAVMPTDTIYGIVGQALNKDTVLRIYNLKKRAPEKPCIILIGDIEQLKLFSINLSGGEFLHMQKFTASPEPTSIILDCPDEKFSYLHRGIKSLAFRLPAQKELRDLLLKTGPLIAPSANPEGMMPAEDIKEAKKYFGNLVDYYMDIGRLAGKASKVIKLHKDGSITILRE